jgi:hypothetical protein
MWKKEVSRMRTSQIATTTFGIAIGCALVSNILSGCGNSGHVSSTRTSPKPTIHVLIDRSHSTDKARAFQLNTAKILHLNLAKSADVHIWAYDNAAVEVIAAASDLTSKQVVRALGAEISPRNASTKTITRPGAALSAICNKASSAGPLQVFLLTDGDIDDAADRPVLKKAIGRLTEVATDTSITVIGIDSANRKVWESTVTPETAHAITLATWAEAASAIKKATKG